MWSEDQSLSCWIPQVRPADIVVSENLILYPFTVNRQNGSGENGTDKLLWTKYYTDKMVLDKMVWTKCS